MGYIRFAINNPVKISVGVILLLLFGLIALLQIPIQLTPNVDPVVISVNTQWIGRSPEEIEREIIEEQEDVLKNIDGLRKMTAKAFVGESQVELEFFVGTDLDSARQEVSDALREVPEYPEQADEPVIVEGEGGAGAPIAWLLLTSEGVDFDVQVLGDPAEERLKPMLERVEGVAEVRVYGGREREVHIQVDPRAMAQRGITFNEFMRAVELENINISAGDLKEGQYNARVRTIGQYDALEQIRETIIKDSIEGGPIKISDIATVEMTYSKRRNFVRSKGELALAMPVYSKSGANVISVMAGLKEQLVVAQRDLLPSIAYEVQQIENLPAAPKLHIEQVYDETGYIYAALNLVRNNLLIGSSFAIISLLLFLRAIRPTIVVALSIPISVIGTFVVMTAFGRNLNVISLAGLAFAVGMVVDNAIVVLENIDRHLGLGKKPFRAALDAATEVWGAILASTLTTLAVFVPILTIEEEAGQLFRDIALAICAAVTLSLLVSVSVIPTFSARLLRTHKGTKSGAHGVFDGLLGLTSLAKSFVNGYGNLLHAIMQPSLVAGGLRFMIVGAFTLIAIVGAALLMPPTDYLPRGNKNLVFGLLITPPGLNIETDESIAHRVESIIRPYWEAETAEQLPEEPMIHPFTGQPIENLPPLKNYFFVSFFGGVFNGATSAQTENVAPVADLLTAATNTIPGTLGFAQQASLFGRGASGGRQIDVEVSGEELDVVLSSASALRGALMGQFGAFNVQPDPTNFDKAGRELQVSIDRVRAAAMGIDGSSLGAGVRALVDGIVVGPYRFRGRNIDILAVRDPSIDILPDQLATMPLAYRDRRDGQMKTIPLAGVANLERAQAPQQILRIEEQRAVKLSVSPPDDMPLEAATSQINGIVQGMRDQGVIPQQIGVQLAGSASKLDQVRQALLGKWYGAGTFDQLIKSIQSLGLSRIFIALLVTYLLMAALFESWLYPFVIMFAVPLATVGGFLGLRVIHTFIPTQQLDTLTMLGFVILIGIVVNNAILIVHQALNFMRGQGEGEGDQRGKLAPREAIRESVKSRMRPIFMTTTTSVSGMLPLVLMPGSGSELYRGLGSVVVGGLIVSTLFTLIVVPLLFSLVMDLQKWILGRITAADDRAEIAEDEPEE